MGSTFSEPHLGHFAVVASSITWQSTGFNSRSTTRVCSQLAKYEKAKIAERTRRGKLRKAREGKLIAGRAASYGRAAFGFKYNESRDSLILDEERNLIVKRKFYMAGVEGSPIYAIKRALDAPERHRVYKMLRVEAAIGADGSLEVGGDVMSVCEIEALST
jgi:DNA invertase Pin-like site-specific DNA recombinase